MRHMLSSLARVACGALIAIGLVATAADARTRKKAKPVDLLPKAQTVAIPYNYPVGSIVIVNAERRLYYVTGPGEARRYGVAVGKHEELWMGRTFVAAKQVDPRWNPVNGEDPIEGGDPKNPLGKRALYLDWSLLRIHGTPSRYSIGSAVSNGCIRMLNEDVTDLYERVHLGAPVFAIRSWADATMFEDRVAGDRIHVNPEAYKLAQLRLKDEIRRVAERKAAEARGERDRDRRRRVADRGSSGGSSVFASSRDRDWQRASLGR